MRRIFQISAICLIPLWIIGSSASAASQEEEVIEQLGTLLKFLEDYDYGDPETWKPDWMAVMTSLYNLPEAQEKAAATLRKFLESDVPHAAKKAVTLDYYHLSGEIYQGPNRNPMSPPSPSQLMDRIVALRKAFESSKEPATFIQRKLETASKENLSHVIRLVLELPGSFQDGVTFFKNPPVEAIHKAQLLRLLATRGDFSIHDIARQYASGNNPTLRQAGLIALQQIGNASDVPMLFDLIETTDETTASFAREALHRIPGIEVDDVIVSRLPSAWPDQLEEILLAIEKRNITTATSALVSVASTNEEARSQCLRSLSIVAPVEALGSIAALLAQSDSKKQRREIETTLYRIAARFPDDPTSRSILRKQLQSTSNPDVKASLRSILKKLEASES